MQSAGASRTESCELCGSPFRRYPSREPKFCAGCRERRQNEVLAMLEGRPEWRHEGAL